MEQARAALAGAQQSYVWQRDLTSLQTKALWEQLHSHPYVLVGPDLLVPGGFLAAFLRGTFPGQPSPWSAENKTITHAHLAFLGKG